MQTAPGEAVGQVKDWMSHRPVMVSTEKTVAHVVALMRTREIRHVLVMDGDRLAGIVSNRDVRALVADGEPTLLPDSPVSRAMSEGPVTVSPETLLTEAGRAMLERRIGALPVVQEARVVGILTRSDVLEALLTWAEQPAGGPGGRRP